MQLIPTSFVVRAFALSLLCVLPLASAAELSLASPFTDHMVLQRDLPVPIWGSAEPKATVELTFGEQSKRAVADADGRWQALLAPLAGSAESAVLQVRSGDVHLERQDVVVGEVWICSGQSNMQMGRSAVAAFKGASEDGLRSFEVKHSVAFEEQERLSGEWKKGGPASAVAFGFALNLRKQLGEDIPVGIIHSSWGSTSIEAWMPRDMTNALPYYATVLAEQDASKDTRKRIQAALDAGKWSGSDDVFLRRQSCIVYNAMMAPLVPYACRGLVWYQGERNTRYMSGMPDGPFFHRVAGIQEYDEALLAWAKRYRQAWGRDDFRFMVVMLPGFGSVLSSGPSKDRDHPTAHTWAWMRESQMAILDLPHTAVANTIDLGDVKNIHPKDKAPIGERLARLAASDTLGRDIVSRGPTFQKLERNGNQLIVHFNHVDGLKTTDGNAPAEFWICDEAGSRWSRATATIDGARVVLQAKNQPAPHHVRYAFTGKPAVNLINGAGLPAYPFRSDDFRP